MKEIPELLAPAGSPEALKAALDAGADAVYLSGKNFGARQFAGNFSIKEMSESINCAHLRGLKVYVTVNTLIKDSEILDVTKYILKLYQIGVDAILVQDFGLIKLAREIVPELDIHASTQMTTHNVENLKWMEKNGFKRAVLSRELSLDEIKVIEKSTHLELEVFLHGALCYSYSGQCLLSSFIGGRSGNRGMCAQPCRKPYSLEWGIKDDYGRPSEINKIDLKENYLLSTRDLGHYPHLDLLVNSGIKSLKIEGRMRSAEYVGTVVGVYRQALDKIAEGNWKPSSKEMENLKLAFNRGFTSGYLLPQSSSKIMNRKKPGHQGLYLGEVIKYNPHPKKATIFLKALTIPQKGDGLFFESSHENDSTGFDLESIPTQKGNHLIISTSKPIKLGSKVYLTRSNHLKKSLKASKSLKKTYYLEISFKVLENNLPQLNGKLKGPYGPINVSVIGNQAMEKAKTRPIKIEQIEKQILKVGNRPFYVRFKNLNYLENFFLPLKEINKLRRDLIDEIESKIIKSYYPRPDSLKSSLKSYDLFKKNIISSENFNVQNSSLNSFEKEKKESFNIKSKDSLDLQKISHKSLHDTEHFKKAISLSAYINNFKNLKVAIDSGFNRIYFEAPLFSENEIYEFSFDSRKNFSEKYSEDKFDFRGLINILNESYDLCENKNVELIWKWPEITRNHVLDILKRVYVETSNLNMGLMVAHPGIGQALINNKNNNNRKIYGSPALNIWNKQSISFLSPLFSVLTLSPELSFPDIQKLLNNNNNNNNNNKQENRSPTELDIIVQGNLESMISQQCILSENLLSYSQREKIIEKTKQGNLFLGLRDGKNHLFPLKISSDGQTIIKNSKEICLIEFLPSLISAGANNFSIDGRDKGAHYLEKMGKYYLKVINKSIGPSRDFKVDKIKNKIKKISLGGISSGNFKRGVN